MKICVIGGGPGGMFFCHSMDQHRRRHSQQQDPTNVDDFPTVTVLEKTGAPGGVWRPHEESSDTDTPNMYAGLWTNGPSPSLEFCDYTFQQHFGKAVPVYMPRQLLLEYMLGRVTHKCPDFFDRYFQFHTTVEHVVWEEDRQQFRVTSTVQQPATGEVRHSIGYYDKCIWAAGAQGKPNMPKALKQKFVDGNFPGRILHSTETDNLEADVRGKRVLMIGSGLSAEDLAIMSIKLGVEQVYISARSYSDEFTDVEYWPYNKVQQFEYTIVHSVEGNKVHLGASDWSFPNNYFLPEDAEISETIEVDTVIFCTGYLESMGMLDESLQLGFPGPASCNKDYPYQPPEGIEIKPNLLDEFVRMPTVTGNCIYDVGTVHPNYYRGIAIDQPNFMVITSFDSNTPILGVEVSAWYLARYCLGLQKDVPETAAAKRAHNDAQLAEEMQIAYIRSSVDEDYANALNNEEFCETEHYGKMYEKAYYEYSEYVLQYIGQVMKDSDYPFAVGNLEDGLNDNGRAIMEYDEVSYQGRLQMANDEYPWRTFRDLPADWSAQLVSLHSGVPCVPLPDRWENLDTQRFAAQMQPNAMPPKRSPDDSAAEEKKDDEGVLLV